jgi:hypothetical protein
LETPDCASADVPQANRQNIARANLMTPPRLLAEDRGTIPRCSMVNLFQGYNMASRGISASECTFVLQHP